MQAVAVLLLAVLDPNYFNNRKFWESIYANNNEICKELPGFSLQYPGFIENITECEGVFTWHLFHMAENIDNLNVDLFFFSDGVNIQSFKLNKLLDSIAKTDIELTVLKAIMFSADNIDNYPEKTRIEDRVKVINTKSYLPLSVRSRATKKADDGTTVPPLSRCSIM